MKKKIREIVREEIKATILFYLIPVDLVAFFSLNSEIKNIKITLAILIVFSLAVLTYYVLWRVIEYLEEKEKRTLKAL
jgi:membrane protein implicated in regulation of membrane protease activity